MDLKTQIADNKKYLAVYFIFIILFILSMFNADNYNYWGFEAISIPIITVIGLIVLFYSFKNEIELHKVALLLIIVFGIMMVFLAPPMSFPDEGTHFTRAELLSEGILYPVKSESGYYVSDYYFGLNEAQAGLTVLDNPEINHIIDTHKSYWPTSTESPFYSYLPSALGILIAKFLNMTAVWALYLARLVNLALYACISYFTIRNIPRFKMELSVITTMPLVIAQISSASYDAFILTITLIVLYYFIKMFNNHAENKDLIGFFIAVLLISFIKPPYIILSLLIFAVPENNFKNNRKYAYGLIILAFVLTVLSVGGILSSLINPQTSVQTATSGTNISLTGQINSVLDNPMILTDLFVNILTSIPDIFISELSFYHYADFNGLKFFNILYMIYFVIFSVFYKRNINLDKYERMILSIIFLITYFGIYGILYLQWTPVGSNVILGIQARYFIPVLALLPLIINYNEKSFEDYKLLITFAILFLIGLLLLTVTHYY